LSEIPQATLRTLLWLEAQQRAATDGGTTNTGTSSTGTGTGTGGGGERDLDYPHLLEIMRRYCVSRQALQRDGSLLPTAGATAAADVASGPRIAADTGGRGALGGDVYDSEGDDAFPPSDDDADDDGDGEDEDDFGEGSDAFADAVEGASGLHRPSPAPSGGGGGGAASRRARRSWLGASTYGGTGPAFGGAATATATDASLALFRSAAQAPSSSGAADAAGAMAVNARQVRAHETRVRLRVASARASIVDRLDGAAADADDDGPAAAAAARHGT
jgi:hypothetical protein